MRVWAAKVLCAAAVWVVSPAGAAPPERIVSMNLCADQLVLLLAKPGTVVSVSFLTADPEESPVAHLAEGLTVNHGEAEEIIALDPDLVVTGRYTTAAAKALLRRLNYNVIEVDNPVTLEGIHTVTEKLGRELGREDQAADLIADLEQRFTNLARRAAGRDFGSVLILDANGFTVGRPSLIDHVLGRIGLTNVAAQLGVGDFGQVTLEAVLLARPDHLVRLSYRSDTPSLANQTMTHRALATYTESGSSISIPQPWISCGGPYVADAVERLFEAVSRQREIKP